MIPLKTSLTNRRERPSVDVWRRAGVVRKTRLSCVLGDPTRRVQGPPWKLTPAHASFPTRWLGRHGDLRAVPGVHTCGLLCFTSHLLPSRTASLPTCVHSGPKASSSSLVPQCESLLRTAAWPEVTAPEPEPGGLGRLATSAAPGQPSLATPPSAPVTSFCTTLRSAFRPSLLPAP